MEIKYFNEFVTLAETRNYLEASSSLFISQSSLSKHIMSLEKDLDVTLFDRTTRHVHLTSEGEALLPYALKMTHLLDEYVNLVALHHNAASHVISIASTSQMVQYSVTEALAEFKRLHLSCSLNVIVEPHKNLKHLLAQHKVDFVWMGESVDEFNSCGFERLSFIEEPLVVMLPKKHPWAHMDLLPLELLCKAELVMQDNSSIEQQVFVNFCKEHGAAPKIISIPGGSLIANFVKKELGIAIMLKTVAQNIKSDDMRLIEIECSPVVNVSLLYTKNHLFSPTAKEFLQFLINWSK